MASWATVLLGFNFYSSSVVLYYLNLLLFLPGSTWLWTGLWIVSIASAGLCTYSNTNVKPVFSHDFTQWKCDVYMYRFLQFFPVSFVFQPCPFLNWSDSLYTEGKWDWVSTQLSHFRHEPSAVGHIHLAFHSLPVLHQTPAYILTLVSTQVSV